MKKFTIFFNKKNFKKLIIVLFLFFIYFFICANSYTQIISNNISDSVFRLHILANSDSANDQSLKYKVRDNVLKYMNKLCINTNSKKEAIEIARCT